jgi:signal transduction histidine kinase
MASRQEHRIADLRGAPRKARESSNRFADEDLRLENQQLHERNQDLELRLAARTAQLRILSHEFRTPLQAIFGYTELLERELHGPLNDTQHRDLLRIQQCQQDLLDLITATLDFAKLENDEPPATAR